MRIACCDCFSGISGDMFLGALVDAGVPLEHIQTQLKLVDLPEEYSLQAETVLKGALRATKVTVQCGESHHHRHFSDIAALIQNSSLPASTQAKVLSIFTLLAKAEGHVHGIAPEQVHFHEVGAVDSIIDILGAVIGLEYLGITRLYASPLPMGSGQAQTQHGLLPLPAPATLEVLAQVRAPTIPSSAAVELVTPTGAAILGALATFDQPAFTLDRIGTGAGNRDLPWPNVLRLIMGDLEDGKTQGLVLMETNIDDMNPEISGHVLGRLLSAGALDAFFTPIYMKKNRPAVQLSVIARKSHEPALAALILNETNSFGLRVMPITRYEAAREIRQVETRFGSVSVKLKILDGLVTQAVPEYAACAALAETHNVPLLEIYNAALAAAAGLVTKT